MLPIIQVQIGDRIEFSSSPDGAPTARYEGRVMDVDATNPHKCAIQISPFEPFRQVDLSQASFKIVYAAGDFTRLKPEMIGWQVEIRVDESRPGTATVYGVIKQVDCDLNCALIAFDDGRKDWRDLSMNAFSVIGRIPSIGSPKKVIPEHLTVEDSPPLHTEQSPAVQATQAVLPSLEAHEFDWYIEGGHVELCDREGNFHEGALLCSLRSNTLQLYNEKRQFFEIQMVKQSFKVIIHGLLTLKMIPQGQAVEIYSPMCADFRRGLVLKAAEVGRLTPIRFEDVGLEWLDLTSQTFKLVFLVPNQPTKAANQSIDSLKPTVTRVHRGKEAGAEDNRSGIDKTVSPVSTHDKKQEPPPTASDPKHLPEGNDNKHHHARTKHTSHKPTALPTLKVGHVVELWESSTKQFVKYRVTRTYTLSEPNKYDLELTVGGSGGSHLAASVARAAEAARQVTINLTTEKARIQLSGDDWQVYERILPGHRVDVYDKVDRSVLSGKIIETSNVDGSVDGPRVHVKLKDGSKRWFSVQNTKIKLKLTGEPGVPKAESSSAAVLTNTDSMWEQMKPPLLDARVNSVTLEQHKKSILTRQHSEKVQQEASPSSQLVRHASTPSITNGSPSKDGSSPSRVPSLDFSGLIRERAGPLLQPSSTSESADDGASTRSQRSTSSNGEALSDLLPTMDDLWLEEHTQLGKTTVVRYVHVGTGEVSHELPQWLKKTDDTTGESYIVNTTTGVRFQPPGSSSSGTTTPHSGDPSPVVVTLPVGPLEAARVASQISAAASSVDLCAEAFGP